MTLNWRSFLNISSLFPLAFFGKWWKILEKDFYIAGKWEKSCSGLLFRVGKMSESIFFFIRQISFKAFRKRNKPFFAQPLFVALLRTFFSSFLMWESSNRPRLFFFYVSPPHICVPRTPIWERETREIFPFLSRLFSPLALAFCLYICSSRPSAKLAKVEAFIFLPLYVSVSFSCQKTSVFNLAFCWANPASDLLTRWEVFFVPTESISRRVGGSGRGRERERERERERAIPWR